MLKIGMVGADSNHSLSFARALNVDKIVRGARVTHLVGETTARRTRTVATDGNIPHIAARPEDLIGTVDAAVIAHRHPQFHLPAARPLLEAGLPLYIDKSLCCRTAEAKRFLARAAALGVPVCSFGVIPLQPAFVALQKRISQLGPIHAVVSTGPCDVKCKWGGVFFYGIHQVEMVLRLLGYAVSHVQVVRGRGKNHVGTITYKDGKVATVNLIGEEGVAGAFFHLSVIGAKGRIDQTIQTSPYPESMYYPGIRAFVRAFRTGQSADTAETMLGAVAVLEGMEKSIAGKGRVGISF